MGWDLSCFDRLEREIVRLKVVIAERRLMDTLDQLHQFALKYSEDQPRDRSGRFSSGGGGESAASSTPTSGGAISVTAYHWSPHVFENFDVGKAGSTKDAGVLGRGIYFTTDPNSVKAGDTNKYTVQVDLKNPLHTSLPDFRTEKGDVVRTALGLPKTATAQEITTAAQGRGHDGVVLDYSPTGYHHQEIVAFGHHSATILNRTPA